MPSSPTWDIYCKVVDNYGDIGVCWRLCADLASRNLRVRLFTDDPAPLAWMAPRGCPGVEVLAFDPPPDYRCGDVVIEAFGCELPPRAVDAIASVPVSAQPVWINLEYLTAEKFAERAHGLTSPVMSGPAAGRTKYFFYPGFTAKTGGLIRETGLGNRRSAFLAKTDKSAWLIPDGTTAERWVSLFCYEPAALDRLIGELRRLPGRTRLIVTAGRAASAVKSCAAFQNRRPSDTVEFTFLPPVSQRQFDELLWLSDLNFVRGEDSLVRAIWAKRAFVWQIYPQDDKAHHDKLSAFLGVAAGTSPGLQEAAGSWAQAHRAWNSVPDPAGSETPLQIDEIGLKKWTDLALNLANHLELHGDLTTQLIRFVQKKR